MQMRYIQRMITILCIFLSILVQMGHIKFGNRESYFHNRPENLIIALGRKFLSMLRSLGFACNSMLLNPTLIIKLKVMML